MSDSKAVTGAFAHPSDQYRAKAFWAWNGKLDRDQLLAQIPQLEAMGFGGFFMHARTGLATPYLGEDWFDCINACADRAEELGLEAWLYDEDRWPSGTAGGAVTQDPAFRMQYLRLEIIDAEAFHWPETSLAAFAAQLDGHTFRACERIAPEMPPAAYAGSRILLFRVEPMAPSDQYNGYTYLDTLQRAATERFLELTHEAYQRHCGSRLGRSIQGVFTDEPHRGSLLEGFSLHNPDPEWLAPWTPDLAERYAELWGESLIDALPELFLRKAGQPLSRVKWRYVELLLQLFIKNWMQPLEAWHQNHGLALTGHLLHEDSLSAQTAMCGSLMRCYPHMTYPGVDVLTESNTKGWIVKQMTSAARQFGKPLRLSELYGATGWQISFEGYKYIGDWQALFGVNMHCPHCSFYTLAGEAKRDHPASIFTQSAWWPEFYRLSDYFTRLHAILAEGERAASLLVLHPVESLWAQVYPGWSKKLRAQDDAIQALEDRFAWLFEQLCGAQIDFDYGDEGLLAASGSVEAGPMLRLGEARYTAVLVSGLTTLRKSTLALLRAFQEAGGEVLFVGDPPTHLDCLPTNEVAAFAESCVALPAEGRAWLRWCAEQSAAPVRLADAPTGAPLSEIYCQTRRLEDGCLFFAMNMNRERGYRMVRITFSGLGQVQRLDCLTGEQAALPARHEEESTVIEWDFAAGQSAVFLFTQGEPRPQPSAPIPHRERFLLDEAYAYTLEEPNVCVLDRAAWRLNGEAWREETEILKIDRALRGRFGLSLRGGEMKQPWLRAEALDQVYGDLECCFRFSLAEPLSGLRLAIEASAAFALSLNGQPLDAHPTDDHWVDACFDVLPIPKAVLQQGENQLTIRCPWREDIGLEALYLLGDFAVDLNHTHATLRALPPSLLLRNLVDQGLPFYSGPVTWRIELPRPPEVGEQVMLAAPRYEGACLRIEAEGREAAAFIGWPPYTADITELARASQTLLLRLYLTRRNTFGPLHQVPLDHPGYGPTRFVTEGASFAEGYMLYPAGFLGPVQIIYTG